MSFHSISWVNSWVTECFSNVTFDININIRAELIWQMKTTRPFPWPTNRQKERGFFSDYTSYYYYFLCMLPSTKLHIYIYHARKKSLKKSMIFVCVFNLPLIIIIIKPQPCNSSNIYVSTNIFVFFCCNLQKNMCTKSKNHFNILDL